MDLYEKGVRVESHHLRTRVRSQLKSLLPIQGVLNLFPSLFSEEEPQGAKN